MNVTDVSLSPLKDIARIMRECHGAIIVAFERTYLKSGIEKQQFALKSVRYTTPWNHIEASLAFATGIPIIVLMEPGLRQEGLLEEKHDWYVDRVSISAEALSNEEVQKRIRTWCGLLQTAKEPQMQTAKEPQNPGKIDAEMTLFALMQMLTLKSAGYLATLALGIFVFGLLIGRTSVGASLLNLFGKS